jgi:hypothetical protein
MSSKTNGLSCHRKRMDCHVMPSSCCLKENFNRQPACAVVESCCMSSTSHVDAPSTNTAAANALSLVPSSSPVGTSPSSHAEAPLTRPVADKHAQLGTVVEPCWHVTHQAIPSRCRRGALDKSCWHVTKQPRRGILNESCSEETSPVWSCR